MTPDLDDAAALLTETGRFARERIATAARRPELPIDAAELGALTREAADLGVLSLAPEKTGIGLWEQCEHARGMAFSLGLLRQVGAANAGVAFAWHRLALAGAVARALGVGLDAGNPLGATMVSVGHYGLARTSLARWLRSTDLPDDDHPLLADWLDRGQHATTLCAPRAWQTLLWPVWRNDDIAWQVSERDALEATPCRAQHGFDELASFQLREPNEAGHVMQVSDEPSRRLYGRILAMDLLGLLAIGAGALARSQQLASDFAAVRRQGGRVIDGHPAVQRLLGDIAMARHEVEAMLNAFARPIDDIDLSDIASARASGHGALCHGANQAVQVCGGMGYMRDAGLEKILRDQNMLKLQGGGTRDALAFLAGWRGASA